ncbi:hypothetical protein [Allorhodopirellula heiligendammensis]|uniref:hypothetical protein n=1 Tax=Allorhodopirellula heiligendammensis TaxID=2714739 RepID=UPI00265DAF9D|nr:hypothetical protein [Allorhodopirellula heiligendammensis]
MHSIGGAGKAGGAKQVGGRTGTVAADNQMDWPAIGFSNGVQSDGQVGGSKAGEVGVRLLGAKSPFRTELILRYTAVCVIIVLRGLYAAVTVLFTRGDD